MPIALYALVFAIGTTVFVAIPPAFIHALLLRVDGPMPTPHCDGGHRIVDRGARAPSAAGKFSRLRRALF
jgi:hypothetical protein